MVLAGVVVSAVSRGGRSVRRAGIPRGLAGRAHAVEIVQLRADTAEIEVLRVESSVNNHTISDRNARLEKPQNTSNSLQREAPAGETGH